MEVLFNGLYCNSGGAVKSAIHGTANRLHKNHLNVASRIVEERLSAADTNNVEVLSLLLQSEFGHQVICSCWNSTITFFASLLSSLSDQVKSTSSAATPETANIYSAIHQATRTLVSVVNLEQERIEIVQDQLWAPIISILNTRGIPIDVQGNCSKILVVLVTTSNDPADGGMAQLIEKLTGSSSTASSCRLSALEDSVSIRLNLCLALLTTLKSEVHLNVYPPHGTLLGGITLPVLLKSFSR